MPQAVTRLAFDGVTGRVAFNGDGDTVNRRLTAYTVKDGKWAIVTSSPATG